MRALTRASTAMILAVIALGAPACGSESAERPSQRSAAAEPRLSEQLLPPARFAAEVARPSTFTLNVHVPDEGSLPGTDKKIPFDRLDARREELPARSTPIAVYCRSGPMSTRARETLRRMGYRYVVELRGGMRGWRADGRRLLPPQS